MLEVHMVYSPQLTEPPGSPSHPQTLWYNPLVLSQQLNLPPVSYRILLSSLYNLNTAGAAWHLVRKTDRYILFEIPVTLALLNFASQPISWLIHHACQVCLFNPLKDTVGLHYTTSCLPKCFALQFFLWFWCVWVEVWVVGGCWMCSRASNWLSLPHVKSGGFLRGNRHANNTRCVRIFPGGVASRRSVNNIMEMCRGFFGSHCLSWITRQSNEPVSTATVTEWGVCIVTHCITACSRKEGRSEDDVLSTRKERQRKDGKQKWSKFYTPLPCLLHLPKKRVQTHFFPLVSCSHFFFFYCQIFSLSSLIAYQNRHHTAVWIHFMLE